jgi:hypothetical protein
MEGIYITQLDCMDNEVESVVQFHPIKWDPRLAALALK